MPAVSLATTSIAASDISKALTLTALTTASNNDYITVAKKDINGEIIIQNADASHAATVVFSAGDGVLSSKGTVTVTVAASTTTIVPLERLETARVLNLTGTNKGKIIVNTTIASGGAITSVSFGYVEKV